MPAQLRIVLGMSSMHLQTNIEVSPLMMSRLSTILRFLQ
jgi:hypothetical protein